MSRGPAQIISAQLTLAQFGENEDQNGDENEDENEDSVVPEVAIPNI